LAKINTANAGDLAEKDKMAFEQKLKAMQMESYREVEFARINAKNQRAGHFQPHGFKF